MSLVLILSLASLMTACNGEKKEVQNKVEVSETVKPEYTDEIKYTTEYLEENSIEYELNEFNNVENTYGEIKDIDIIDENDVWKVVMRMSNLFGIENPSEEIRYVSSSNADLDTYYFDEYCNGCRVYGRGVTVTVDGDKVISTKSSYIKIDKDSIEECKLSKEDVDKKVKGKKIADTTKEIYEHNDKWKYVYIVYLGDREIMIDANTGNMIIEIPCYIN